MKKNYYNIYFSIICKVYYINKVGCIYCVFFYYIKNLNIFFFQIEFVFCNKLGKEFFEDEVFVEDLLEFEGKEVYFKLKIENVMGLLLKFIVSFL